MRGLLRKSLRDSWKTTAIFSAALFAMEVLIAAVFPSMAEQMGANWLSVPFFRNFLSALLGTEVGDSFGPTLVAAIAWVHPVVLVLSFSFTAIQCTRVPAAEVDHGTAEFLFTLPATRWQIYLAETLVFLLSAAFLLVMGLLGSMLGFRAVEPEDRPDWASVLLILTNLYCLIAAAAGVSFWISARSERRGRCLAVILGILLVSFLWNFLAQFWAPARSLAALSMLYFYQPLVLIQSGEPPWRSLAVLCSVALSTWGLGGRHLSRRDIACL